MYNSLSIDNLGEEMKEFSLLKIIEYGAMGFAIGIVYRLFEVFFDNEKFFDGLTQHLFIFTVTYIVLSLIFVKLFAKDKKTKC